VKQFDAIVAGGGVIGLAVARELHKRAVRVLVLERGEPGREASHAAAGMLAYCDAEPCAPLQTLKLASARLYPEFVRELQDESQMRIDFRREGTISFLEEDEALACKSARLLTQAEVTEMEPCVAAPAGRAFYTPEESVDNRQLVAALRSAARHRGIEVATGAQVTAIHVTGERVAGAATDRASFAAPVVVNCAGAWAGGCSPVPLPVRPRKGQMLAVALHERALRHVLRAPDVYVVPRSDGRILIGATVEDVGYDKRVEPETIQRLHQTAANLVPALGEARMLEAWAGLRPAAPDGLPILGATSIAGYFVATSHFRNGILLAPITAEIVAQLILGEQPEYDLARFSPARF
jgi:glycine oxidase